MSDWLIPKKEDVDLTEDGKELHILFETDDFGARYISLEGETLKYIIKLLKINEKNNKRRV